VPTSELGRREQALAAIEQAVEIRRGLAAARPDAFLPDLASSLNNQSNTLSELGRREDALAAIEEAVELVLPMLERAHYAPPDAGLKLVQTYLRRWKYSAALLQRPRRHRRGAQRRRSRREGRAWSQPAATPPFRPVQLPARNASYFVEAIELGEHSSSSGVIRHKHRD
jgi:tetratricopeptide (TPR) repeat protein